MMKVTVKNLSAILLTLLLITSLMGCHQIDSEAHLYTTEPTTTQTPNSPPISVTPEIPEPSADVEAEPSISDDVLDSDIAERILHELTRSEYKGRVTGSEEVIQAGHFLVSVFGDIGLIPYASDSFIMEYANSDPGIRYFSDDLRDAKGYNIVGVMPGKDRTKAVVVSAHYDAVGITGGLGALDNASGIAAMLHVADSLLHLREQPETDIIFCAFDGEEIGLVGSQAFVLGIKDTYQELFNINIDTIGLSGVPVLIIGDETLMADISETFTDSGIALDYETMIGGSVIFGSDDTSFRNHGFAAITIAKLGNEVLAIMHSENDVLDVLDIAYIESIADVVTAFLIKGQGKMY